MLLQSFFKHKTFSGIALQAHNNSFSALLSSISLSNCLFSFFSKSTLRSVNFNVSKLLLLLIAIHR